MRRNELSRQEAWERLRGTLKGFYTQFGGGEAYLRSERETFYDPGQDPMNRGVQPQESSDESN